MRRYFGQLDDSKKLGTSAHEDRDATAKRANKVFMVYAIAELCTRAIARWDARA